METPKQQERPLITFLLICYNQEQYIKEALEGAFSQTYSPLEIVISDDYSTDRTFAIIEEEVGKYQGSHSLRINQNSENRGIVGNFNVAFNMSNGELVVVAAGDDVSKDTRVEEIYRYWNICGKTCMSILTDADVIDENGKIVGKKVIDTSFLNSASLFAKNGIGQFGATSAYHRKIYDIFGSIDESVSHEDRCMVFRQLLIGKVSRLGKSLVNYRIGGITDNNISSKEWSHYRVANQYEVDIKYVGNNNKEILNSIYYFRNKSKYYIEIEENGPSFILFIKGVFFYRVGFIVCLKKYLSHRSPVFYLYIKNKIGRILS